VIVARAERSWRWYRGATVYLGLIGGSFMLVLATLHQGPSSLPLLVIGGWWIAFGCVGIWQWRRVAGEVRLDGERISFVFPARELTIRTADLVAIRRARGDLNHWLWLRVQTRSHGTIRVAARLRGVVDLLAELRRLNPYVTYPSF
jgi:hypothetical protein